MYWFKQRFAPTGGPPETNYLGYYDWDTGTIHHLDDIDMPTAVDSRMELNRSSDGASWSLYLITTDDQGAHFLGELKNPDTPALVQWHASSIPLSNSALSLDASLTENFPGFPATDRYAMITNQVFVPAAQLETYRGSCCHTDFMATGIHHYVAPTGNHTWTATNNPFMDHPEVRVVGNFTVPAGSHITATGLDFRFAADGALIIEPGGSLVCHGCTFRNNPCDERWKGIELHGNFAQHQGGFPYPEHQGFLLLNNSTVKNAEIGVLVAHRNAQGNIVKTKEGGVLRTLNGTRFENNRQGVFFRPYQNFNPTTGVKLRNLSRFNNTTFTVNADYPERNTNYDFMHHMQLWRVDGIQITACAFKNELADNFFAITGSYPGSQYLGYGIYSLDADFRVQAQCTANPPPGPGQACPVGEHNPTLFQGLDHGIHARTGTTLRNFTVDRAQFTDNIAGVYTEGVIGYKVVHSLFEVGGRNVDLSNTIEEFWDDHHRGLYTYTGHAFIPDFNHFARSGPAPAEGIVIGYSLDHNDMVFGNSAEDIDNAYVGEGICLSLDPEGPNIGLQLLCNDNENNTYNLTARIALSAPLLEWESHGIRASQGDTYRAAGNTFDQDLTVLDDSDYRNDTERAFDYFYEGENTEYQPADYNTDLIGLFPVVGGMVEPCASRMLVIVTEDPPGMVIAGEHLQEMKLAYGNTRYQYEQLLDGGNTDEVVQQIVDTWPQDVWDLRDQLLAMSPYLSDTTLRKLVNSPTVPDAIKTELLIANPEGVRNHGIVPWIIAEELLPTYMVAQIVASWDQRTYRFTLENDMGHFHSAMSQAATRLLSYHAADSTYDHLDSLITTWQEIRTPAARYSEAMGYLERGRYTNAAYAVQSIPQEHKRLNHKYLSEKDRMLGYISFLESVHLSGRELNELDSTEVAQLQSLIAGKHDRPAVWAQNLLCFHYGLCSPPHTGGKSSTPKAFPRPENTEGVVEGPQLGLLPNPASVYVAVNYDLKAAADRAYLLVRDLGGREVNMQVLGSAEGQVVIDTRRLPAGVYTVELHNAGQRLLTQKLIVQP